MLRKATWSTVIPGADLPRWVALYRRLWSRGAKSGPGPSARFYEADLRALERAVKNGLDKEGGHGC